MVECIRKFKNISPKSKSIMKDAASNISVIASAPDRVKYGTQMQSFNPDLVASETIQTLLSSFGTAKYCVRFLTSHGMT